jgi:hypothetical protein
MGKDSQTCMQRNESKQAGELNLRAASAPVHPRLSARNLTPRQRTNTLQNTSNWAWIKVPVCPQLD